jgi:glycogen debranching enzyme
MGEPQIGTGLTFTEESQPVHPATVTLVEGATFAICGRGGDIGGGTEGVFVADTRICSHLELHIDGELVEPLTVTEPSPFTAFFVGRSPDREVLVERVFHLGVGLRVDLAVRNLTNEARTTRVALDVWTDLADIFSVKEGRPSARAAECTAAPGVLTFRSTDDEVGLAVTSDPPGQAEGAGRLCWDVELAPRSRWSACLELAAQRRGDQLDLRHPCGEPTELALPATRQAAWNAALPSIQTDIAGLDVAYRRSVEDLGSLRLFDPREPRPIIAAGAPWFMTLFGRDSILASLMAIWVDPDLALATAHILARLQGTRDDPGSEEQPGRILHEVRFSTGSSMALEDGDLYYGTVDATPLFVVLVDELRRWGTPADEIDSLLPAVDAALGWIAGPGDPDGDGYLEYRRRTPTSLANQGWKDSFDAISFADGRLADPPIALAEVQGYAYAAWLGGARLAEAAGDRETADARRARAATLQERFERDFWLDDRQALALALDGDKHPVDAVASNMGHCLWSGIVRRPDQRAAIADRLLSPEMFCGWGVRTLGESMGRYNPISYHNGSVWPHDTAICVAGLRRAGHHAEALRLAEGLLAAADARDGRLPELFAGIDRDEIPTPVDYPASCSPQAWAAASPLLVIRSLLGLEADLPDGHVTIDPHLPEGTTLDLEGVNIGPHRATIRATASDAAVDGLPDDVEVRRSR